jgi:Zn-dependent M28 family amino/carboxypeptidase
MPTRGTALALCAVLAALGGCAAIPAPDGARAHARVVHQVDAGPRIPGTPGHAAIAEWIGSEITRLGGRLERDAFTDTTLGHPMALVNLIGHFGPAHPARRIVLAAHWDSRPWSDEDPDMALRARPMPGANDGGSGVAVLLEVAEMLHQKAPRIGVDLVFFDGEDQGRATEPQEFCLGARRYASLWQQAGPDRPVAAFLFDMVGDRDLNIAPEVQSTQRASNLVELVLDGARATGARHFTRDPGHALTDDHIPLLDAGLPAVDIIDFDYHAWHTSKDLPDQVSPESLAEVSKVAGWLVYQSPLAK